MIEIIYNSRPWTSVGTKQVHRLSPFLNLELGELAKSARKHSSDVT